MCVCLFGFTCVPAVFSHDVSQAGLVWKHGLRACAQQPASYSPLPYRGGQPEAYLTGDKARELQAKIISESIAVNSFWSSSRGAKSPSEKHGSYTRLPEGSLWSLLATHALNAKPPSRSGTAKSQPAEIEHAVAVGQKNFSTCRSSLGRSLMQRASKALCRPQRFKVIGKQNSRQIYAKRKVAPAAHAADCPIPVVAATSPSAGVPWPEMPEHAFIEGSQDFREVRRNGLFFPCRRDSVLALSTQIAEFVFNYLPSVRLTSTSCTTSWSKLAVGVMAKS